MATNQTIQATHINPGDWVNVHGTPATSGIVTRIELQPAGVYRITLDEHTITECVGWHRVTVRRTEG